MRQVTYISTPRSAVSSDMLDSILKTSRHNNRRDGLSGLLFFDGTRFLQALEGPEEQVRAALARIRDDERHFAVVVLSDREVETREFGDWDMAARTKGDSEDALVKRLTALSAGASPAVRATFDGFAQVRRRA